MQYEFYFFMLKKYIVIFTKVSFRIQACNIIPFFICS